MRYTVILLLLSACAGVPENQTASGVAGGYAIGPGNWGYAQATALWSGTSCPNAGYSAVSGFMYGNSYNCGLSPWFYSAYPYLPYYSSLTPAYGAHYWRHRAHGGKPGSASYAARATPGSTRKRK